MRVYVPSMGRAGQLHKKLTHHWIRDAVYVVPPDEVERYERNLCMTTGLGAGNFTVLACEAKGIAAVRHWIGQYARSEGETKFCMMDDDLQFAVRVGTEGYKLRPQTVDDVRGMLQWVESKLDDFAHASVSPRDVAHDKAVRNGTRDTLWLQNKRALRVLAYRTKEFLEVEHGRVPVMEDFDVTLQLMEKGYANAITYWYANNQSGTGSAGGCSSYRTKERHNEAAEKLAALHPKFVTLRDKPKAKGTSTAEELRDRKEVIIQWIKAWESSQ